MQKNYYFCILFSYTDNIMTQDKLNNLITSTADKLCDYTDEENWLVYTCDADVPVPSTEALAEVVKLCRTIFFPSLQGEAFTDKRMFERTTTAAIHKLHSLLTEQIAAGLLTGKDYCKACVLKDTRALSEDLAAQVIAKLPEIRQDLITDVEATYKGDPAATGYMEIVNCYPVIKAMVNYRVAHVIYELNVPIIPRMLTEMAHSETGIDIHPGAQIGTYFTIDHGTGVVIGATTIIGKNVKLYQGVTLGAKSFPVEPDGSLTKGIPRHPILEDDVIVYSNATILGRITIGKGAVVGGNVWITEPVAAGSRITQYKKDS